MLILYINWINTMEIFCTEKDEQLRMELVHFLFLFLCFPCSLLSGSSRHPAKANSTFWQLTSDIISYWSYKFIALKKHIFITFFIFQQHAFVKFSKMLKEKKKSQRYFQQDYNFNCLIYILILCWKKKICQNHKNGSQVAVILLPGDTLQCLDKFS